MTHEEEMALRRLAAEPHLLPTITEQLGPMSLWSQDGLERLLERTRAEEAAKWAKGAKVSIPNDVMEQEFALHNRRGYSDGYKAAKHQASIELAAMRAQLDAALSAMSGMAALQANPPVKLLANAESYEAGRVMEREACAKICDERKKAFDELLKKYGNESDAGAVLGAGQCGDLIRARGQQ